jgi:hypothetical protein
VGPYLRDRRAYRWRSWFRRYAGASAGIAKLLFFVFVVGFVLFLALGVFTGRKIMR